ncbi:MAG TPA: hypothetical protein DCY13_08615 [Verrucomicrobiales bacterium]|nr:hypothetical protein [Verrucomicrobiales bacterium]
MQPIDFDEAIDRIVKQDPRYDREAYRFVRDALDHTQARLQRAATKGGRGGRKSGREAAAHHVSGRELLDGIREFALKEFGPMVLTLFEEWGIHSTADFGEIVFNMVDARLLNKTDEDSRNDFKNVFDFQATFRTPFLPEGSRRLQGGTNIELPL